MTGTRLSRRTMVVGGGVAAALFAAAFGLTLPRLLARRYAPTPYDDLLAALVDREQATRLGAVAHAAEPAFNPRAAARELRQRLERRTLAEVIDSDIRENRVAEIGGWVVPESLAQLCLLAAVKPSRNA
jgi:hypothetical protein